MVNISERLQVVYGDAAEITIESQPDHGTLVRLVLPILLAEDMGGSVAGALYEARSSTSR
jgi:LytS/YehU family sensor histidine kinase